MDVVQKLRKDTKMHPLLTPKQNKLQHRLSLVEKGESESMLKTTLLTNLSAIKVSSYFY